MAMGRVHLQGTFNILEHIRTLYLNISALKILELLSDDWFIKDIGTFCLIIGAFAGVVGHFFNKGG
jgi:hypothetical protein